MYIEIIKTLIFHVLMLTVIVPCYAAADSASGVTGQWLTFDEETGEKRSIILIRENREKIYGQIINVFFKPDDETKCINCAGEKYNQDIVGLEIFSGLTKHSDVWQGSTILDPENGKEYEAVLWLEENDLKVRGYIFMFYRTQTWKRMLRKE